MTPLFTLILAVYFTTSPPPQASAESSVSNSATVDEWPGAEDGSYSASGYEAEDSGWTDDPQRNFSSAGDLYFAGASAAGLGGDLASTDGQISSAFATEIDLSAGYFITKGFGIGGKLALALAAGNGSTAVSLSFGPVFTGRVAFGQANAFLANFGLLYAYDFTKQADSTGTQNVIALDVSLPAALRILPSIMLTVGPYFRPYLGMTSVASGSSLVKGIEFGCKLGLLGWR